MRILGLSSFGHDTSAALIEDGVIRAVVEESKLSRQKDARGLPAAAIKFCLSKTGAGWHSVDAVALTATPLRGWMRRSTAGARISPLDFVAAGHTQVREVGRFAREIGYLRLLRHQAGAGLEKKIVNVEHQLSHAASAYFLSRFDRALVVTMDEDGDGRSGMAALGEGTRLRKLHDISYPHSLAWLYSRVTEILGFVPRSDEHKTQWLSLGGEPEYIGVFREMLRESKHGSVRLDYSYLDHGVGDRFVLSAKFWQRSGLPENPAELSEDQRRNLAASVQQACAEKVGEIVESLCREHKVSDICLGGGLFNNSLLVASLEQQLGFDHVFVPPAPGNSGTSLGAALYLQHHERQAPRKPYPATPYWGPGYSRHDIKDVLDNCKARFSFQVMREKQTEQAIQLLLAGKIIGWFQGAAEFGPRALGNRSVLASPWAPYVKENLNDFIKHREWFRPFAISVPVEDAPRYFECSSLCESMNTLARIRPGVEGLPEDFVLPGGMVRLHTVSKEANPVLWDLLKRFGLQSAAPMLINTSFNLFGEPLVVSPLDAIRSYSCSGIDALLMDNFLLTKAPLAASVPAHESKPMTASLSRIGA
ncbi:MAG TPA: carbamoyltransferase C-terminal domain-containing protein [Candidatus Binatia bacterium]|nr:carbamoyltransferase C-terminal domain-containing protein [Candidatus Binatia bacterium]